MNEVLCKVRTKFNFIIFCLFQRHSLQEMQTPIKLKHKILNSTYSPFSSLASSKTSTNCDYEKNRIDEFQKKRFSRKRDSSNDSLKRFKTSEVDTSRITKQYQKIPENAEDSTTKDEKHLPKLPFKKDYLFSSRYMKLPTERSHNIGDIYPTSSVYTPILTSRHNSRNKAEQSEISKSYIDYKMQLQMKNSEMMILEDENARLKAELKTKQNKISKIQKEKEKILKENEQNLKKLDQKIKRLESSINQKTIEIRLKDDLIERGQKAVKRLEDKLKRAEKETQILKSYIENSMNKKISQQTAELMSYRELSLQNHLNELKTELSQTKSQNYKHLEQQILRMRQKLSLIMHENQNLSVANRMLTKKNQQINLSVQKRFKNEINETKDKIKQLIKQSSVLRKQNLSLKTTVTQQQNTINKTLALSKINTTPRTNRLLANSTRTQEESQRNASDDSFSISLSK